MQGVACPVAWLRRSPLLAMQISCKYIPAIPRHEHVLREPTEAIGGAERGVLRAGSLSCTRWRVGKLDEDVRMHAPRRALSTVYTALRRPAPGRVRAAPGYPQTGGSCALFQGSTGPRVTARRAPGTSSQRCRLGSDRASGKAGRCLRKARPGSAPCRVRVCVREQNSVGVLHAHVLLAHVGRSKPKPSPWRPAIFTQVPAGAVGLLRPSTVCIHLSQPALQIRRRPATKHAGFAPGCKPLPMAEGPFRCCAPTSRSSATRLG